MLKWATLAVVCVVKDTKKIMNEKKLFMQKNFLHKKSHKKTRKSKVAKKTL